MDKKTNFESLQKLAEEYHKNSQNPEIFLRICEFLTTEEGKEFANNINISAAVRYKLKIYYNQGIKECKDFYPKIFNCDIEQIN